MTSIENLAILAVFSISNKSFFGKFDELVTNYR